MTIQRDCDDIEPVILQSSTPTRVWLDTATLLNNKNSKAIHMKTPLLSPSLLALFTVALIASSQTLSAQVEWDGGGTNDLFGNGENWVGGIAPGTTDQAAFLIDAITSVDFDSDASTAKLLLTDGVVTFNLFTDNSPSPATYHTYTLLSTDTDSLVIGNVNGDEATLRLQGFGSLPVSGSTLATTGESIVGNASGSSGTLEIVNNARLNLNNRLFLGFDGTGTLSVSSGEINGEIRMAENSSATATLTLSGPDTVWNASTLFFIAARDGTGLMIVEDGAQVTNSATNASNIGQGSGGDGALVIRGENSQMNHGTNIIRVGDNGKGTLIIEDGGTLTQTSTSSNNHAIAGRGGNPEGTAFITGTNSNWTTGANMGISVGTNGQGTLIVADNGVVAAGRSVSITHTGHLYGDSTVQVSSAGFGVVNQGGLVSPGLPDWDFSSPLGNVDVNLDSSIGTLTLDANFYTQEVTANGVGTLEIKIGTGTASQLNVLGDINLISLEGVDPILKLIAFDNPTIGFGDTFQILSWTGTLTGEFEIDAFTLTEGLEWDFSELYSSGQISVIPEPNVAYWIIGMALVFLIYRRSCR